MSVNQSIEFHDSTVHTVRTAGPDAVIEMTVYVHASTGRPGVDAGTGWHQRAQMLVSGVVLEQNPSDGSLDLYDGIVTVDGERLENLVPIPFDRTGKIKIELRGEASSLAASGSAVRIVLTGVPGPSEQFPGTDP